MKNISFEVFIEDPASEQGKEELDKLVSILVDESEGEPFLLTGEAIPMHELEGDVCPHCGSEIDSEDDDEDELTEEEQEEQNEIRDKVNVAVETAIAEVVATEDEATGDCVRDIVLQIYPLICHFSEGNDLDAEVVTPCVVNVLQYISEFMREENE